MKKLISLTVLPVIFILGLSILNSCSDDKSDMEMQGLAVYDGNNIDEAALLDQVFTSDESKLKCGGFYPEICGEIKFYPLIASQHYYVGALLVYNDAENLYVSYWTGWWLELSDFHLYVGSADGLPLTNADNPKFGKFPYKDEESNTGYKTFVIPLSEIPECYVLVAHAVLGDHTVLAYGETPFLGSRWGWTIEDCIDECESEEYEYYTIKLMYIDQNGDTQFAVLELSELDIYDGDWCDNMGVVQLEAEQSLNLMFYGGPQKTADINIKVENGAIYSTISFVSEEYTPLAAHVFYGTLEELETYGTICPNYPEFPYYFAGADALEFSIPLN